MSDCSEFKNKEVICRKPHSCEWCATKINAGERARYRAYRFDGDFQAGHMHLECYHAMSKSPLYDVEDGWSPGDFERGQTSLGDIVTPEGHLVPDKVVSAADAARAIQRHAA
jgi:hypothetical protein